MKTLLLALTVVSTLVALDPDEARAQAPKRKANVNANANANANPLMPNLGVPYTDMRAARSLLSRGGNNRNRNHNRRRAPVNRYYQGIGPTRPF